MNRRHIWTIAAIGLLVTAAVWWPHTKAASQAPTSSAGESARPGPEAKLEQQTQALVQQYRNARDTDQREALLGDLERVVSRHFDLRQELREGELEELEREIERLRSLHERRQDEKDRIVQQRIESLLREADGLGWGSPHSSSIRSLDSQTTVGQLHKVPANQVIIPGVGVGDFTLGMSQDEVLRRLGEPRLIYCGGETYTLDNLPRRYGMNFGHMSVFIIDDVVQRIDAHSSSYTFTNGLGVGDSEDKVKQALGSDFELEESADADFLSYNDEGVRFTVRKKDRTVEEIQVFPPTDDHGEIDAPDRAELGELTEEEVEMEWREKFAKSAESEGFEEEEEEEWKEELHAIAKDLNAQFEAGQLTAMEAFEEACKAAARLSGATEEKVAKGLAKLGELTEEEVEKEWREEFARMMADSEEKEEGQEKEGTKEELYAIAKDLNARFEAGELTAMEAFEEACKVAAVRRGGMTEEEMEEMPFEEACKVAVRRGGMTEEKMEEMVEALARLGEMTEEEVEKKWREWFAKVAESEEKEEGQDEYEAIEKVLDESVRLGILTEEEAEEKRNEIRE